MYVCECTCENVGHDAYVYLLFHILYNPTHQITIVGRSIVCMCLYKHNKNSGTHKKLRHLAQCIQKDSIDTQDPEYNTPNLATPMDAHAASRHQAKEILVWNLGLG